MPEQMEISLQQVLEFREKKVRLLQQYQEKYPGCTAVTLGMNIPGPHKNNAAISAAFLEGTEKMRVLFKRRGYVQAEETCVQEAAGNLAVFVLRQAVPEAVKADMIALEEACEIGRLYDIDVYRKDGTQVGREELHAAPRKCFLCGNDAKSCGRSRRHSVQELEERMYQILDAR